jgi:hypothetical protein
MTNDSFCLKRVIYISESIPINTIIYKFEAYDPDSNPSLTYFLFKSNNAVNGSHARVVAFDEMNRVVDFSLIKVFKKHFYGVFLSLAKLIYELTHRRTGSILTQRMGFCTQE